MVKNVKTLESQVAKAARSLSSRFSAFRSLAGAYLYALLKIASRKATAKLFLLATPRDEMLRSARRLRCGVREIYRRQRSVSHTQLYSARKSILRATTIFQVLLYITAGTTNVECCKCFSFLQFSLIISQASCQTENFDASDFSHLRGKDHKNTNRRSEKPY